MTSRTTTGFDVRRVSGALGAEVRGIDLDEGLDDETFEVVHAALLDHHVLFFPAQHLRPDAHVELAAAFGECEIHPYLPKLDAAHPEIVVLDATDGSGFVADVWHTDVTFEQVPPKLSILHMITVPEYGGDTMWTNQEAVYDALSEPMRDLLDGLTAVHWADVYGRPEHRSVHPVVRVHPETGRKALFVNRQFTKHIVEMSRTESDALLAFLYAFSEQPQFSVRRSWQAGDVGMWDNRCTQHYAVNDYRGNRRLQRVTVLDDGEPEGSGVGRWEAFEASGVSASTARYILEDQPPSAAQLAAALDDRA